MTSDDESAERSQRTVAELLAQYGDGAPATGRRRARRRPEDTGSQPAADPSRSQAAGQADNGEQAARDGSGPPDGAAAATSPPTDLFEANVRDQAPGDVRRPPDAGALPPPGAAPRQRSTPQSPAAPPVPPNGGFAGHPSAPRYEPPAAYPPGQGPVGDPDAITTAETAPWYQPPNGHAAASAGEPPTDQLPRYEPHGGPVHTNGRGAGPGEPSPAGGPGLANHGYSHRSDDSGEPTSAHIALDDLDPRDAAAFGPADELDGVADAVPLDARRVDRAESEEASPTTAWLAMVAQWIGGAIGGAALWVAFRYLWTTMPVVALVAAVLVTGGLVLLVRAIRRSDDLKTTVFAVLVGLVVTVSPAVLVLVTR